MSGTASTSWAPPDAGGRQWVFVAVLVLGVGVTAATAVATNGSIVATIAPILAVAILGAIWVAPMRITLIALVFLCLAPDATGDGPWDSPFAPIGHLLTHNLDRTIPVAALTLPLVALVLGYLLVIRVHRWLSWSQIDAVGRSEPASPLLWALGLSFGTVLWLISLGIWRGGDIQMAKIQVQTFVLLLLMAYLLAVSLRGMRDYRTLGGLILAAACSKSLMALWAYYTIKPTPATATTHGDSILFAFAATLLVARLAEQPVRRNAILAAAILPLIVSALVVNNRRIGWVELAAALLTLYVVSRRTRLKRSVTRAVILSLPLLLAYVTVGWNSSSSVFAPVKVFRSVEDSDVDGSTLFRDLENYNLLQTMRRNPIVGAGFGQPFDQPVVLPDISFFKEYSYMPHNSILGLWGFTGLLGFTGLFLSLGVGVHFAARSYYHARRPDERVAAFMAIVMVLIYLIQCWGDIGFSEQETIFLVGPALAVAGQLARSTGAWSVRAAAPLDRRP